MKISDVRTLRLVGPLPHGGGGSKGTRSKVVVRVDTDQGVYGLGEVEDFMGVREAIAYMKAWLVGRSLFNVPFLSEMVYGTLPPHPPVRKCNNKRFAGTFPGKWTIWMPGRKWPPNR